MRSAALCLVVALFGAVIAEPPSGYSYSRPSSGGFGGHGGSALSSGGSYQQVSHGGQTNEGQNLDYNLLEQIKQVLLRDEASSGSHGAPSSSYGAPSSSYSAPSSSYGAPSSGSFGGFASAPSSSYGAPSSSYGAPSSSYGAPSGGRVTGLDLEGIQQAIQVAQFTQQSSSGGGYARGPSSSYGAPSSSYGAPY